MSNQYIVKLTRNIGDESDVVNYFKNRGLNIVYQSPILPKTIGLESDLKTLEDLQALKYVKNAKIAPKGRLGT
jgi:hypothetical protein